MLQARGSALISGQALQPDTMRTVRALRGFIDQTKTPRGCGDIVSVPSRLGIELVTTGKAEWCESPVVEVRAERETTETEIETQPAPDPAPTAPAEPLPLSGTARFIKRTQGRT